MLTAGLLCATLALPRLRRFGLEATLRHLSNGEPTTFGRMASALASVVNASAWPTLESVAVEWFGEVDEACSTSLREACARRGVRCS